MIDLPIRLLAIIGATAAGAFGVGSGVQLVSRLTTRQKLPYWLMRTLRLLGGIVTGWLAAIWLIGGGHGGWGLGDGKGLNTQNGIANFTENDRASKKKTESQPPANPVRVKETIRIEVLGDPALQRIFGSGFDPSHCYRVEIDEAIHLLTLPEIKDLIRKRQQSDHPLHDVVITLYNDSPANDVPRVSELKRWIEEDLPTAHSDKKIVVNIEQRGQDAPAR